MLNSNALLSFMSVALLGLSSAACSTIEKGRSKAGEMRPDRVEVKMDREDLTRSVQSPLYDLNLKREDIPKALTEINEVYNSPSNRGCRAMRKEMRILDAVLGPDQFLLSEEDQEKVLRLKPGEALESAMSSVIPFTDIVRYLSGAEGHQKKLAQAYVKGQARRAYLQGYAAGGNCDVPTPRLKPDYVPPVFVVGE